MMWRSINGWIWLVLLVGASGMSNAFGRMYHDGATSTSCAALGSKLQLQWRIDSTQVTVFAASLQACYTQGEMLPLSKLSHSQADTLLRIYQIGIAHDPAGRAEWLRARATLAMQRSTELGLKTRKWLLEAIFEAPQDAPLLFFSQALQLELAEHRASKLPLQEIVADWALLDRHMLLRELGGGEDAQRFAALHKHFRWEMRRSLPDCSQLLRMFSEQIATQNLPAAGCQTFLLLYELQGCDSPPLWEAALTQGLQTSNQPWLQRLAGAEAFNRGDWQLSRAYWLQAIALEEESRLQANDQLQIAQAWLAEHDYRKARTAIQAAIQLHPNWGEPYIRLMDLYLEGNAACNLPSFDQKALYWLLIDLCRQLQNVDTNYVTQANERIYLYRSLAPTPQEASFLGFRPGDSVPIKCWMSTTTTVPMQ